VSSFVQTFLSAILSARGPGLMCFPQFSAILSKHRKRSELAENEKNNHRKDLTRMVS
jgi:hypothetical protein